MGGTALFQAREGFKPLTMCLRDSTRGMTFSITFFFTTCVISVFLAVAMTTLAISISSVASSADLVLRMELSLISCAREQRQIWCAYGDSMMLRDDGVYFTGVAWCWDDAVYFTGTVWCWDDAVYFTGTVWCWEMMQCILQGQRDAERCGVFSWHSGNVILTVLQTGCSLTLLVWTVQHWVTAEAGCSVTVTPRADNL